MITTIPGPDLAAFEHARDVVARVDAHSWIPRDYVSIAVAAYYQGMSSVRRIGMLPSTRTYVASVLALRSRFGG